MHAVMLCACMQERSQHWNSEGTRQRSPDSPTDSQSMADMFAKLSSHSHAFSDTAAVALGPSGQGGLGNVSAELPTLANGMGFSIPDVLERSGDYGAKMLVMHGGSSGPDAELGMPEFDKESLPRLGTEIMAAADE